MDEFQGNVSEQVVSAQPETINYENQEPTVTPEVDTQNGLEEVVDPQVETVEETVKNVDKEVQSQEMNSHFAKLRREAEQKGMDRVISEMNLEWQGRKITNYSQYQQALREQQLYEEAQNQNIDPQFYVDFKNMQNELHGYRQERTFMEQERELSNDSSRGEFYNQWKDEIKDMARLYDVDLKTAFTITLENKLPEILSSQAQRIKNETISKINENGNSSVGSLGQQGENKGVGVWDMTATDFNTMLARAKNGDFKKY